MSAAHGSGRNGSGAGRDDPDRTPSLEGLVARAREGDRDALETVVRRIQDDVYGLAVRMLWHPADAEDAAQEILVRVITKIGSFRGESAFRTWVYRVASNYLLTTRKRRAEREEVTFASFGRELERGLSDEPIPGASEIERRLLVEEMKIGCSQGMLLCLDRGHRLAYILGEILELDGPTAAAVLGITPAALRKRLSRARRRLHAFLRGKCGLVDSENPCRCRRRVRYAIEHGRVDPGNLLFARPPPGEAGSAAWRGMEEVEALRDEAAVLKTNPEFQAPEDFAGALGELLRGERYPVITADPDGA